MCCFRISPRREDPGSAGAGARGGRARRVPAGRHVAGAGGRRAAGGGRGLDPQLPRAIGHTPLFC